MDQFNVVPLLIGLVFAAGIGFGSGLLAVRAAGDRPLGSSPIGPDAGRIPPLLFWLGFVVAAVSGLYGISSSNTWLGVLLYLMIFAIAAAAAGYPARLVRERHNRELSASGVGWGEPEPPE